MWFLKGGDRVDKSNYRACMVDCGTQTKRGMFHCWTSDGGAIVEGEHGECAVYPCSSIRFLRPIIDEYINDFYQEDMRRYDIEKKHYEGLMID